MTSYGTGDTTVVTTGTDPWGGSYFDSIFSFFVILCEFERPFIVVAGTLCVINERFLFVLYANYSTRVHWWCNWEFVTQFAIVHSVSS